IVAFALSKKLFERPLHRLGMIERHTVGQGDHAGQVGAPHVVTMTTNVHLSRIGSEGSGEDVDVVVAHGLADLVNVLHKSRSGVLTQVIIPLQLSATVAGGRGVEWRLEVFFYILIRSERATIQAMAIACAPFIHQDDIMLIAGSGLDHERRKLGGRFAWSASHVEDGTLVAVRM